MANRDSAGGFREFGQGAGDLRQRPGTGEIGEGDGECCPALGGAQGGGDAGAFGIRREILQLCEHAGEGGLESLCHAGQQTGGFAAGEFGEVRRVAAEGVEHRAPFLGGGEGLFGRAECGKILPQATRGVSVGGGRDFRVVGYVAHLASTTR